MLSGLTLLEVALLLAGGVLLDLLLGEARRWHPLVGFGNLAMALERRLNRGGLRFWRGVLAWALAVLPLAAIATLLVWQAAPLSVWLMYALHAVMLYFALGLRSLRDHNLPIAEALAREDLPNARLLTARLVGKAAR